MKEFTQEDRNDAAQALNGKWRIDVGRFGAFIQENDAITLQCELTRTQELLKRATSLLRNRPRNDGEVFEFLHDLEELSCTPPTNA